jgi:exosortase E/protease (VPEID-CTERM system)
LRDDLAVATRPRHPVAVTGFWVLAHLAAFALFAAATGWVLGPNTRGAEVGPWAVAAWVAAGGLTVGLLAAAAVPPRAWPRLVRRGRGVLAVAAGVAVAAGLAAAAAQRGWDVLSGPTLRAAYGLLRLADADAVCDPAAREVGTRAFRVEVSPACSGYEGLGLMSVCLAVYFWHFRRDLEFPRALLLVPLGLAAVWVANVGRIAGLVLIGDRVSPELALGGFHSQAGWLGFNAVVLGLLIPAHRSGLFARPAATDADPPPAGAAATVAYLAPFLVAVAVQMAAEALLPDPAAVYPVRLAIAVALLWVLRGWYDGLRGPGPGATPTAGLTRAAAVGTGVFLIWFALVPASDGWEGPDGLTGWLAAAWALARVVGYVVITPLSEELAFRGYLLRRLVAADFRAVPYRNCRWPAVLASSVIFGVLHGHWVAATVAGVGYALVVMRTGRLRDAVVAHAVTNGLLVALGLATGDWHE